MDSPEEEKRQFSKVMSVLILPEEGITSSGVLSQEIIDKVQSLCCCSLFRSLNVVPSLL
jgi:Ase1/PRC1/MAP65 family protein